jgi:sulfate adenylyltransferase subunit 2
LDRLQELEVQSNYILREAAVTIAEFIAEPEASRELERAGRAMDQESEDAFERLRANGHM